MRDSRSSTPPDDAVIQPIQHGRDAADLRAGRDEGTVDHYDRQPEFACRVELRLCAGASGVLGDHHLNMVLAQQRQFPGQREGTAIDDQSVVRETGGLHRIDEAQQVEMLRSMREVADGLATKRQEDTRRFGAEPGHRFAGIAHARPAVAGTLHPFGPGQREKGTPVNSAAAIALALIRAAKGWVASTRWVTPSRRICSASPSTPPKPPTRVGIACARGASVRPA